MEVSSVGQRRIVWHSAIGHHCGGHLLLHQLRQQRKAQPSNRRESGREYERLQKMRALKLSEPLAERVRPTKFSDIVGQEDGIKSLKAILCGKNPQHVLIYGPPGVGKTCAARLALEAAKRSEARPLARTRPLSRWTPPVCALTSAPSPTRSSVRARPHLPGRGAPGRQRRAAAQARRGHPRARRRALPGRDRRAAPHIQSKLLQLIQEKTIERLSGTRKIELDFRLIVATNRNLEEEVQRGLFRSDLFYRLNVIRIHIPPLRQRKEDIFPLAHQFLARFCGEYGKASPSVPGF